MKSKALIVMTVVSLLAALIPGFMIAAASADVYGSLYPEAFVVIDLDEDLDLVYIENCNGQLYSFYGVEDWDYGDIVAAIMSDVGTDEVSDDEIIAIRYAGYMPLFET